MSQREEAEEEGVHPTEPPLCGRPESQTGAQSPEQQRPESAGLKMNVEDNVSTESLPEIKLSNLEIVWCPPTPFDFSSLRAGRIDDVITPLDPKGSPVPLQTLPGSPQSNRSHGRKQHFKENHLSPKRKSPTSSEDPSTSSLSFKSKRSKKAFIDSKERRPALRVPLQTLPGSPQSNRSHGRKQHFKENHLSPKKKLQRKSSDHLHTNDEESSTSSVSFESNSSKSAIINLKERQSALRSDYSPSSVVEDVTIDDVITPFDPRGSPADCSPSSEEEEGAADDDDDDDVQSSDRLPELQRPESAGRRMDESRTRSTGNLRSTDICDIPLSPTSSGYSSASGLSCKSDGSKDNTIIDFKGRSSTLMADCSPSSEEEEGAAHDDDDVISPFDPTGSP